METETPDDVLSMALASLTPPEGNLASDLTASLTNTIPISNLSIISYAYFGFSVIILAPKP